MVLSRAETQPPAELLNKDNRRLGLAEHDDLVHGGDVNAFVEDVDGEDVVEIAGLQLSDALLAYRDRVLACQRNCAQFPSAQLACVECIGECMRFVLAAAEDESSRRHSGLAIQIERLYKVLDALWRNQNREVFIVAG